jgi:hypothetical protein
LGLLVVYEPVALPSFAGRDRAAEGASSRPISLTEP